MSLSFKGVLGGGTKEEERIPRTRTSAGTTEPVVRHKKTREVFPVNAKTPTQLPFFCKTKQKETQGKITVTENL